MSKKNKRPVHTPPAAHTAGFNPDYSTTRRELRRIAILAGIFLTILIVLAIFQKPLLALFIK